MRVDTAVIESLVNRLRSIPGLEDNQTGRLRLPDPELLYWAMVPQFRSRVARRTGMAIQIFDVPTGIEAGQIPGYHTRVSSVTFAPDGRTLASGSEDNGIRLWNVANCALVRQFVGHQGDVLAVTFSPNGLVLASGSADRTVRLWDVSTGEELAQLLGHQAGVTSLSFAPDGELLASGSQDMTIRLWDMANGHEKHRLRRHHNFVEAVAFAPDGKILASGSWDRTVRLWDVATGEHIDKLGGHAGGVKSLAFSPDGKTLASGSTDRSICLWQVSTRRKVRQIFAHEGVVFSLAFSPDGKTLASGSEDRNVVLWDVATGKEVRRLPPNQGLVSAVAFSPDGRHLAAVNTGFSTMMMRRGNVSETAPVAARKPPTLGGAPPDLEKLWTDLADEDARTAYNVTRLLASIPDQSVPFLRGRLRPAEPLDLRYVAGLVANLYSSDPLVWQKARLDLLALGHRAEPTLREALRSPAPGEGQKRLTEVMRQLSEAAPSAESLRELRAVGVLLKTKTAAARQVLEDLAQGAADAVLTQEARAALKRFS